MRKGFEERKKSERSRRAQGFARRRQHHPWVECDSGKVSYRTKPEAELAANFTGMKPYQCPRCEDWHLTESPQRRRKR